MPDFAARFQAMSPEEADRYFDRYLEHVPTAVARLRDVARERGGPADALDYSAESLLPLWEWALTQLKAADAPPQGELPPWLEDARWEPHERFLSHDSYWLVDGIAAYFAEAFLRAVPGSRWVRYDDERDGYHQRPLIEDAYLDPLSIVIRAAGSALYADEIHLVDSTLYLGPPDRRPEALLEMFRRYAERAAA